MYFKILMLIFLIIFCFRKNGTNAKRCEGLRGKSYCCDNHEDISGTCIACNDGFFSVEGEPCQPCFTGFFGRLCIHPCRCSSTQSCDNVKGCIDQEQSTTQMYKESANSNGKFHDRITNTRSSPLPSVTSHDENNVPDFSLREIVVYSVGIGVFISLVMMLLYLGNILRKRSFLPDSEHTRNNVQVRVISGGYGEGIYETIDESNMIDDPLEVTLPISVETTSTEESTDSEHSRSLLNHEYLNPYQPMVPDPDKHEYEFVTDKYSDDSGSTVSSGTNPGYLNPYTQIILDSEPHNYLSIQAELHCLLLSISDENQHDDEYNIEENIEQMEHEEQTQNEEEMELQDIHSQQYLTEIISNSETETQLKRTGTNCETPVDDFGDSLPVEVSINEVPSVEASNTLKKSEPKESKPQ